MAQSYNYTPSPVVYGSTFNLAFTDNTGTIDGNNTYNLTDASSNILSSFNNTNQSYGYPINGPEGVIFDNNGNMYVACNLGITKITPSNDVSTFVSINLIASPTCLAFDSSSYLYVTQRYNDTISKISPNGVVSTFVSSGLNKPIGLAFDSSGYLYVANNGNNTISKISPSGVVSTLVSSGLSGPNGLTIDSSGNLYVSNFSNNTIKKISSSGVVSNFVSSGLTRPVALTIDSSNNIYCSHNGGTNKVKKYNPNGTVAANSPTAVFFKNLSYGITLDSSNQVYCCSTDNIICKLTTVNSVPKIFYNTIYISYSVFDSSGNLYTCNSINSSIVKILPNGFISSFIASPFFLNTISGLAFDSSGYLYVGNTLNSLIYKITPTGSGLSQFAQLEGVNCAPDCLVFDSNDYLYISDSFNLQIIKVSPSGTPSIFVSSGLMLPYGLAFDSSGYLYVADYDTIKKITPDGVVSTFVSSGINESYSLAIDSNNNLYVANYGNNTVSKITPDGVVSTFVSSGINQPRSLAIDNNQNLYLISINAYTLNLFATTQLPFTNATSNTLTNNEINNLSITYGSSTLNTSNISVNVGTVPCFLKGTNILTDKGYIPIENLKKGDLIQTFKNGFVPTFLIGNKELNNNTIKSPLYRLYKYSKDMYPELFDDLIITGGHSILVDEFTSEKQQIDNDNLFSCTTPLVDGKHCLLSCNNEKAVLYEKEGVFTIYHLALENDNEFGEYGIFANGLLTESCNIHFFKKFMNFF